MINYGNYLFKILLYENMDILYSDLYDCILFP